MPELQIGLQPLEETGGDHRRPMSSSFGHLQEETAMPTLPLPDPAIGFNGDPAKQVFDACIEGMQERGESRELDGVRRLGSRLTQERLMKRQQLLELSLFNGDLILEIRPHAEESLFS
jgi:hypothetical protein